MPTIGKIKAELLGDTRHFDRSFQRAGNRVRRFENALGSLRRLIIPLTGAIGFGSLIRSTFREADELGNLARRLDTSVEGFSRLSRVLGRSGIGMNQTAMILQRLQRRAADAQDGNEGLAEAFRQLGINVDRLIQMDPVQAFVRVAEALAQVQRPAERIQLAFRLLDSEGVAVLQANLPKLRQEMAATSAITDAQAKSIKRLSDNWSKLGESLRSLVAAAGQRTGATNFLGRIAEWADRAASSLLGPSGAPRVQVPAAMQASGYTTIPVLPRGTEPGLRRTGNVITGGLETSNQILDHLRGIRKNTELKGAVLE